MKSFLIVLLIIFTNFNQNTNKVLVFSKTEGYRHESIETGVQTLIELGRENSFEVTHTENAEFFTDNNLKAYDLVIFLSTSGDFFNANQEQAFEKYIKNGGNFMGIHGASAGEYDWAWYGKLLGGFFLDHPEKSNATIKRVNDTHQSTKHLPEKWTRYDEWYNYKSISPNIKVLLTLDETTYKGGKNGENHPIAWCQEFNDTRSFYTGLGHTIESYSEPEFREHILGGILYCLKR